MPSPSTSRKRPRVKHAAYPAEHLHQVMYSFVPARVTHTAIKLGVFAALAGGARAAAAVARATGTDARGMRMLLDALVGCRLLRKKGAGAGVRYSLEPVARRFLVPDTAEYIGGMFENDTLWDTWQHLAEAVRTGRPVHQVNDPTLRAKFFPALVRSLHIINRDPARRTAAALVGKRKHAAGLKALDVACGSGVWGIALAEADRAAQITALDFETTLGETRKFVEQHKVARHFRYQPGDLNQTDFGRAEYDVVYLGHILHIEGEQSSRRLLKRVARALSPGGRVVIAEMVPNDARTGPPYPLFFALNMLLNTALGDTWTIGEFRQWLRAAGFRRVEVIEVGSHSPVIIGTK